MSINENLGLEDEERVFRSCLNTGGFGDQCVNDDILGVEITECFCATDNCNKDLLCNCPSTGL